MPYATKEKRNAHARLRYRENADAILDKRRPSANKNAAIHRERNREGHNAASRKWYAENIEYAREYGRNYHRANRDRRREYAQRYHFGLKTDAMRAYSTREVGCARCSEMDIDVLTLDHVHNDGAEQRRAFGRSFLGGTRLYCWLKKHNYPSGFQVLCANCNLKKELLRLRAKRSLND